MIWYNPPFCKSVKTNVGKEFFKILKQCFPPNNPLSKLLNRNTVKISYSCMPSIGRIISGHNRKILNPPPPTPPCTCTLYECVVDKQCETKGILYQCEVIEQGGSTQSYIGLSENSFKDRQTYTGRTSEHF